MAESQKYYLGDTIIYRQYLGDDPIAVSLDLTPYPTLSSASYYWDAGVVSSYPGSGSVWTDIVSGRTALISGFTYGSTPRGHIDFNGTTGAGVINTVVSVDDFTLVTWFRMDGTSLNTIIGKDGSTALPAAKILFYENGDVQFRAVTNSSFVRMNVGFLTGSMLGEWHQLAVKRDTGNNIFAQLDNNGWVTGSSTLSGTFSFDIIANNPNEPQEFDGAISNLLMYSSSLQDYLVTELYDYYSPLF